MKTPDAAIGRGQALIAMWVQFLAAFLSAQAGNWHMFSTFFIAANIIACTLLICDTIKEEK